MSVRRSGKFGLSVFLALLALMMWLGLAAVASAQPTIASVSSSTHPDEATYYTNNTPAFSWEVGDAGSGISGYWYQWDKQQSLDSYTQANPSIIERFGDPVTSATPGGPSNVAVGDLNGDGKDDVVIAEPNGHVDVMLGDGLGWFALKSTVSTGKDRTLAVVVADFNVDGKMDVAATTATTPNQAPYYVAVMFGDGSGNLGPASLYPGRGGQNIVAADFNNDNWPDVATANGIQVSVFMNTKIESSLFPSYADIPGLSGDEPSSLAVGKVDGGDNLDLVAVNPFPYRVAVLLGDGAGSFTRKAPDPSVLNYNPNSAAIADFDGDGHADVAVTYNNPVHYVSILRGNGDGTFSERKDINNFFFGYGALASTVADFNNDGKPDLAVVGKPYMAGDPYNLSVMLGNGDFTFANPANSRDIPNATPPWPLIADDFTGDGQVDLLTGVSTNSTVNVYPNTTLTPSYTCALPEGLWYFHVRAVDKDGSWSDSVTRAVRVGTGPILAGVGSTDLDSTGWSTTLDPTFTWTPADPLTLGYSWVLTQNLDDYPSDTYPGQLLPFAAAHATGDGTWYFMVNAVDATGHWGTVSELQVPIDATKPTLTLTDASSSWSGTYLTDNATYSQGDQVFASFDSQDDGSGPDWGGLAATLRAPDSSISMLSFVWDGEGTWPPMYAELDTSRPGNYMLTGAIADVAGNQTYLTVHYTVSGPAGPPTTTLDPSFHPDQWKSSVGTDMLMLNAVASPGDILASMSYSWDGDSPSVITVLTSPWSLTVSGYVDRTGHSFDGVHTLNFHSTGVIGGAEAPQSAPIGVDTISPVTVASGSDALWHNTPVVLTFDTAEQNWAAGAASGLGYWTTTFDGTNQQTVTYPTTSGLIPGASALAQGPREATEHFTVPAPGNHSGDGDHTVAFWSNDVAMNFGNYVTATVKIDTLGPSAPTISGGGSAWFKTAQTVSASLATDATSGVASYEYQLNGGSWSPGNSVGISTEGTTTVAFRAVDNAGNYGTPTSTTVKIDTLGPSAPTISGGGSAWFKTAQTVSASLATDATSGVASYEYQLNGGSWSPGNSVGISTQGTTTVAFRAVDNAGNPGPAASTTVKIDTLGPTVNITKPLAGDYYRRTPTVNSAGTVTDAGSGIASQVVTIDGAAATLGGPLNMNAGTHTFRVVATDRAGNVTTVSVPYTVSNTADTTPPTVTITNAQFYDGQSYPANQPLSIDFTATDSPAGTSIARWSVSATGPSGPIALPPLTAVGTNGATTGIVTALTSATGSYVATIKATDGAGNTTSVVVNYSVAGDWGQGLLTKIGPNWVPSPPGNPLPVTVSSTSVVPFEFKLGGEIASVSGGSGALTDLSHARLYIVDPATNKLVYKAPTYFTWSGVDQAWKYNLNVSSIWSQIPCGSKGRVLRQIIVFCDPQGAPKFTSGCGSNSTITDLTPVSSDAGVVSNAVATTSTVAAAPSSPAAAQPLAVAGGPSITGISPSTTSLVNKVATSQVVGANFGTASTNSYISLTGFKGGTTAWSARATIKTWTTSKILFTTPENTTGTFNLQVFVGTTGSNIWNNPVLTITAATGSTDIRWIRGG